MVAFTHPLAIAYRQRRLPTLVSIFSSADGWCWQAEGQKIVHSGYTDNLRALAAAGRACGNNIEVKSFEEVHPHATTCH